MIRLGLIGLGSWGQRYVDRVGRRSDCSIRAVVRSARVSASTVAGAETIADWQGLVQLAAAGGLDGIIAATQPDHQADVALACAHEGVPLLVEKPLGLTSRAALAVLQAFETSASKPPILVDYIHLWAPAFVALREHVREASAESAIATIASRGWSHGPFRSFSPVFDYGAHDLAMILTLIGLDAPINSTSHHRLAVEAAGGELHEFHFSLGPVSVRMQVGNGASTKARLLAVRLLDGREWVYDDQRAHPGKLEYDGRPIPVETIGPLDRVIEDFVRRLHAWRRTRLADAATGADLALSVRINGILEQLST